MLKQPCVYMITNQPRGTLYVGVTSNLPARVWQHQNHVVDGFSSRYRLGRLVWFELHADMLAAISREKQLKAGSRKKKIQLVETLNPDWRDLSLELV